MTQDEALKEAAYFTEEVAQAAKILFIYCSITIPILIALLLNL